jgi:cytoskeleton protein RodZ
MSEAVGQGFGRILAEAREAKGLSVADVADKLKLTPRQIEALETEDLERLPSAVFVRGFVRNYARLLNIPESALPAITERAIEPTPTITAPSEDLVFRTSPVRRWLVLPLVGLIVFMLLVVALYNWLRQGEESYLTSEAPTATETAKPAGMPAASIQAVPAQPVQQPAVAAAPESKSATTSPDQHVDTAMAPAPVVPPATPPAKAETPPSLVYGSASVAAHTVSLVCQDEESWIDVTSADNHRYTRLLQPGEQMTVHGLAPLQVVVGNALHVQVTYDNKAIDLKPHTGDRVARLTLQ